MAPRNSGRKRRSRERAARAQKVANGQPPAPTPREELAATRARLLEEIVEVVELQSTPQLRLSAFMRLQPPTFAHSEDPIVAYDWLHEIEKKLKVMRCDDAESVFLGTHQLVGAAMSWWDSYVEAHPTPDAITWSEFVREFRSCYISEGALDLKADEFRDLKQGSMSVDEYIERFIQLARYAPHEVSCDKRKQQWFRRGLDPKVALYLISSSYSSWRQLAD